MPRILKGPFDEVSLYKSTTDAIAMSGGIEKAQHYLGWASDTTWRQNPSDNHASQGYATDVVNFANGAPTVLSGAQLMAKANTHTSGITLDLRELYERGAYHVWNMEAYRTGREMWKKAGKQPLADQHHVHLRAICSAMALASTWLAGRTLTKDEMVHYGPAVVTADGPVKATVVLDPAVPGGVKKLFKFDLSGLPSTAMCGVRSANTKQQGSAGQAPNPKLDGPPAWRDWPGELPASLVKDILSSRLDGRGRALKQAGLNGYWLTQEEANVLSSAANDDQTAIRQALDWLRLGMPPNPFRIIRSEKAVFMAILSAPSAPTATLYAVEVERPSGVHRFVVADPGDRHNIKSGTCTVALDGTSLSCTAQRDAKDLKPAWLKPHDIGPVYLDIEFGGSDQRWIERVAPKGSSQPVPPVQPPATPPPPKKESKWTSWL